MNFERAIPWQDLRDSGMEKNRKIDDLLNSADKLEEEGELFLAAKKIMKAAKLANTFQYKDELYNRAYELFDSVDGAENEAKKCLEVINNLER